MARVEEMTVKETKTAKTQRWNCNVVNYKAPSKKLSGTIGLKLEYVEKGDSHILYAYVKGVRVILSKGCAGVEIRRTLPKTGYKTEIEDNFIVSLGKAQTKEIKKFLCEKYNIENRSFEFLCCLAQEGKALLTKSELKEQVEAFREGK